MEELQALKQLHHDREIPSFYEEGIMSALKYFNEIIKCEEEGKKIDGLLYAEAYDGRKFNNASYIKEKMEKLSHSLKHFIQALRKSF